MGEAAAHDADIGADNDRVEPQSIEDARVGLVMELVAVVEASRVEITAVAVFHDELANPDQSTAAPRLVAELGLEVVDEQWELAIAAHQVVQQACDHLLVGHGQHHVAPGAVLEAEQFRADLLVPAALAPQVRRLHHRHLHLLCTNAVHLLPDHLLNPVRHPPSEGEQRVDPRADLAYVSRADQEPM